MESLGVGIVGLSASTREGIVGTGWGYLTHYPAVQAVEGLELRGHVGSSLASGRRTAEALGLDPGRAFPDAAALAADDAIDLVAICVRVPEHFELVKAVIDAGKAVLCEWPLARTTDEAEELHDRARAAGVRTAIGIQACSHPTVRYVGDLIRDGELGDILSVTLAGTIPVWGATCTNYDAYTAAHENGASMSRIGMGHALAGVHLAVGMPEQLTGTAATTRPFVHNTETGEDIPKTSADVIAASGVLPGGGVFSAHFRGGTAQPLYTQWWTDGTAGSIVVTAPSGSLQYGPHEVRRIAPGGESEELVTPASYGPFYPDLSPPAQSIAHQYALLRDDLDHGTTLVPDFAAAVELHRFLDRLEEATGAVVPA